LPFKTINFSPKIFGLMIVLILVAVWVYGVPKAFAMAPEYPSGTLSVMAFFASSGAFIVVRSGHSPQRLDLRYLVKLDENLRRDILDLCKESITKEELILRLKEKGWKIGK